MTENPPTPDCTKKSTLDLTFEQQCEIIAKSAAESFAAISDPNWKRKYPPDMDLNCLSYWFPILRSSGVNVPRTEIVRTDVKLIQMCDGKLPDGFDVFLAELRAAALRISPTGPWFLRTGQTSDKHEWEKTCCLTDLDKLPSHIYQLVEFSECCDMLGLPTDVWVVREMLDTKPKYRLPRYGYFPVIKELRGFVDDCRVLCVHPYWPAQSLLDGIDTALDQDLTSILMKQMVNDVSRFTREELHEARMMFDRVARTFQGKGAWSVDALFLDGGVVITDMAVMDRSFHWPGCPYSGQPEEIPKKREADTSLDFISRLPDPTEDTEEWHDE